MDYFGEECLFEDRTVPGFKAAKDCLMVFVECNSEGDKMKAKPTLHFFLKEKETHMEDLLLASSILIDESTHPSPPALPSMSSDPDDLQ